MIQLHHRFSSLIGLFVFALGTALFTGCGGGGGGGGGGTTGITTSTTATSATTATTSGSISVSVSPASVEIVAEDIQQFTASVSGSSNQAVTWSVLQGQAGGEIDQTGFYQAPTTAGTYTIVAASNADPSKVGTAQVTVRPGVVVTINPQQVDLDKGQQKQFTVTVQNATNPAVEWSLSSPNAGTITSSGLFTASQIAGPYLVFVESVEDPDAGNDFAFVTVR